MEAVFVSGDPCRIISLSHQQTVSVSKNQNSKDRRREKLETKEWLYKLAHFAQLAPLLN